MSSDFFVGRLVRRLVSPARKPRGQWVSCERPEAIPFEQRFPRVPPTFMTASEHAYWLKCEAAEVMPAPFMADTSATRDAWLQAGLACSRSETNSPLQAMLRNKQERVVSEDERRALMNAALGPFSGQGGWLS